MEWKKYRIKTTVQAEDYIGEILMEEGIMGIEIEDRIPISQDEKEELFIDILPELPEDNGEAYVSFYMETGTQETEQENSARLERIMQKIKELKESISVGEALLEVSVTKEEDWINNWKQYFEPFWIDGLLIKPTWVPVKEGEQASAIIELDPGTSFGTGRHETTRLCIRQLQKKLQKGMSVLDIGCGSGILGIAAAKMQAGYVRAIDIDPRAAEASCENREVNQIPKDIMKVSQGNILEDDSLIEELSETSFDIVVANIFPEIIIPMCGKVYSFLKKGGLFITSGILKERCEEVRAALREQGMELLETQEDGDWVLVTGRK